MIVLGIESSCDETAAALVEDGRKILSSVVASQVEEHKIYGGVVPEIASRRHSEAIVAVVQEALERGRKKLSQVDAIAVTYAPGLIGALLVGVNFAKGRPWCRCTICGGTSLRGISATPGWSRPFCAWWPRGGTATSSKWRTTPS